MSVHRFFAGILRNVSDGRNGIGLRAIPAYSARRSPCILVPERTKAPPPVFPFRAQDTNENGLTFRLQPAGFDVCTFLKSPRNPLSRHTIRFTSFRFTDLRNVSKSPKTRSRRPPSHALLLDPARRQNTSPNETKRRTNTGTKSSRQEPSASRFTDTVAGHREAP